MKKYKRFLAILAVCLLLVSAMATTAFATSTRPYGSYDATLTVRSGNTDIARATMDRCSCLPVNNHLKVLMRYQYKDGNNYITDPGNNMYYYKEGNNVEEITVTHYEHYIYWVEAVFYARCGSGSQKTYTDAAYR